MRITSLCFLLIAAGLLNVLADVEQVRIALTAVPQEMLVSWISDEADKPVVYIGSKSGKYDRIVNGDCNTYNASFYQSKNIHFAVVDKLEPGTTYYYVCGDDQKQIKSKEFSFKMPDYEQHSGSIALIGDLGQTQNSLMTAKALANDPNEIDLILHVGDLSYADGVQPRWDTWGRMFEFLSSKTAWMTIAGNHEMDKAHDSDDPQFIAYKTRFRMPKISDPSERNFYWSMDYSYLHIVGLSTETDFSRSSNQFKWFIDDMEKVNRTKTPFVVVMFHRPFYNSNEVHQNEKPEFRPLYEPYFKQFCVDIVLSGHVHAYERTYPVYNNVVGKYFSRYFNIGDGGNREGLAKKWKNQPEWSAFHKAAYGYARFDMYNSTHLQFSWISNEYETDEFYLSQGILTPMERHIPSDTDWIVRPNDSKCSSETF